MPSTPGWQPSTEEHKLGHIMLEKDVDIWEENNWPDYLNLVH